jgi:hypothetical protein
VAPLLSRAKAIGAGRGQRVTRRAISDEDVELLRQFASRRNGDQARLYAEHVKIQELRRAHDNLRTNQRRQLDLEAVRRQ